MGEPPPALTVHVVRRQRRLPVDAGRVGRVLRRAARELGVGGEIAVVLTTDRAVRALNRAYRGKDAPTDVLSFPGSAETGLGDVLISVETAERNARALRRTLAQELDVLALHGLLHVLGYDHETDRGEMERLEGRLRRRILGPGAGGRRPGTGAGDRPSRPGTGVRP